VKLKGCEWMGKYYPESRVEVSGLLARHYDRLLDLVTFGRYRLFIERAIGRMNIETEDRIIDFATGTGRNACLMMKYLSPRGRLVGLDISESMILQFRARCRGLPNIEIVKRRVDRPLGYESDFDKAFVSFALHGFPQEVRLMIIDNAFSALKNEGEFFILDYNELSLSEMPWYIRLPFRVMECRYALDFIRRDWKRIMGRRGFGGFSEHLFFGGYVRLLKATKTARPVEVREEA